MKTPKSFEEGISRLQNILAQLQSTDTSLDKAVKLYAEAAELIAYCNGTLRDAKLKIEEIDTALQAAAEGEDKQ